MEQISRMLVLFAALSLSSTLSLAQQTPSTSSPSGEADSVPRHRSMEPQGAVQSARSFEGTILRSGTEFVLRNTSERLSYRLDDQSKAKRYLGKRVKVTATMDSGSNTLHVIEITASSSVR